jgi:endonuclease YncB( thermonuclease family)
MYINKSIIQYCILTIDFAIILPPIVLANHGMVFWVSDGDTITVLINETSIKIMLYGIDCPERGQDFGQKDKRFASDMVFGKTVMIKPTDKDRMDEPSHGSMWKDRKPSITN